MHSSSTPPDRRRLERRSPATTRAPSGTFLRAEPAEPPPRADALGRGHVLVVEDTPELCAGFLATLEANGYRATGVGTLEAGLAAVTAPGARFDAILCELKLPDGRAPTLIERARRLDPPPVTLVISAHLDAAASLTLARLGVPYFPKPFADAQLEELMQLVELRRTSTASAYAEIHGLSRRETEALGHSLERRSLRKAATLMGISTSTLKEYWLRIFEKTGLRSQADVVRDAVARRKR